MRLDPDGIILLLQRCSGLLPASIGASADCRHQRHDHRGLVDETGFFENTEFALKILSKKINTIYIEISQQAGFGRRGFSYVIL